MLTNNQNDQNASKENDAMSEYVKRQPKTQVYTDEGY